ncbi:UNKNOWN [Stylonychia lemnae]|uniref:Uncharacterized protein n=1 Tax=Stylonychia lemnae TaxID=5949 RepID=A0A077ZWT5_STYLE|nr:UNKNOWN [Stylonychia lemnae]|eukprot:CDW74371.1 UNKNOWN [Stylonychia lemnae]
MKVLNLLALMIVMLTLAIVNAQQVPSTLPGRVVSPGVSVPPDPEATRRPPPPTGSHSGGRTNPPPPPPPPTTTRK